eukprot:TRINITY_DN19642_c2_g1_i1.p1 TRINITY_DN19642_c2_g1~~TRINITY_DN19642_c2_g1_i1.p1  ORF type:complete len:357 (+),score=110.62 TRINITY_DN19642_c2_g1_i1:146-1072(+)
MEAAEAGDLQQVTALVQSGADPGRWGEGGDDATQTPRRKLCVLHHASRAEGFDTPEGVDVLRQLISKVPPQGTRLRCDPQDGDQRTPLWEACRRCHTLIAKELLRQGANPGTSGSPDGTAAIHHAAMEEVFAMTPGLSGEGPLLQDMLTPEALRATDARGSTALHYAAYYGNPAAIRLLLDAGADPTVTDSHGYMPGDQAMRPVTSLDDKERELAKKMCAEMLQMYTKGRRRSAFTTSQGQMRGGRSGSVKSPMSRKKSLSRPTLPPPAPPPGSPGSRRPGSATSGDPASPLRPSSPLRPASPKSNFS